MKISEAWLREWVDPELSSRDLANRLTMAGLEVDNVAPAAPMFTGVVVARVIDVAPHPASASLSVCRVDDGQAQSVQVVCGAPNVREGMLAPLARVGAALPCGVRIETANVRGIESFGMLCSARDLGLAESSTGLMWLQAEAPVGQPLRDYLHLDDAILEIELTPNRGDCLSVAGIARELMAITGAAVKIPAIAPVKATIEASLPITIEARADCPRYAGRIIRSITPGLDTPLWLQERLRRSGLRSINPVVDVTNYVMLELGQPMHAFDLTRLRGGIRVRRAKEGESLTLLDGREIALAAGTLIIADHEIPLALAGIMGGKESAVNSSTRDIFLESAFFAPRTIAGRARANGLNTDSSYRFERGVDPDLQVRAIERATALLLETLGGDAGPVVNVAHHERMPQRLDIVLRPAQVEQLLGVVVPPERIAQILCSLGCQVKARDSEFVVRPPSFRFDLAIEADLIEEVGRIHGYDRIPVTTPSYQPIIHQQPDDKIRIDRLRTLLVDRGYQEAITYSFVDADADHLFHPEQRSKRLANPISTGLAVMRSSLWPGLVKAVQYNLNRQQTRVRLFEVGLQFAKSEQNSWQAPMLAAVATGDVLPEQWGAARRAVDFYDIKGDVEVLLRLAGVRGRTVFQAQPRPALHPGQSARIVCDQHEIGWLGALHPAVEASLELQQRVFVFEVKLKALTGGYIPHYREVSKFPAIRRDIAILVDESVTAAQVEDCVLSAGGDCLQDLRIFDVYSGEGVADGRKSLALGLILQDLARTLRDEEVDAIVSRVVDKLTQTLGASLRV
jgi:phenylalanyl-tRNA synthetase beta chain